MKSVGLVVEYNPFHNGHKYHIDQARIQTNAEIVIAVMSGSFLQRGEPALLAKWQRTKMALNAGVDLVVELPYAFSVQTAKTFATGAIRILTELGCDSLHFGSEAGQIEPFNTLVHFMKQHKTEYDLFVQKALKQGMSYPAASAAAFTQLTQLDRLLPLSKPNNILGFHYVQAINEQQSTLIPYTTKRLHADYHDAEIGAGSIASATSIRNAIAQGDPFTQVVPEETAFLLKKYQEKHHFFHQWEAYFPFLQHKVLSSSLADISKIAECEEGIEHRVIETGLTATSVEDWLTKLKTKRYTRTRLQRLFAHLLTGTTKEELQNIHKQEPMNYIRLLGMTELGKNYLNQHKKQLTVPLVTRQAELKQYHTAGACDLRTSQCYWLASKPEELATRLLDEYKQPPIYLKKP
ncbi:hypothetical protein JCM19046_932 [Bacillus sp. JCM 19046]|nr:hypothetical protein JCM19045_3940 [Bacillus sp. JCM 19045]GAF16489.1 hypothetical protein JCM19046_932 [Bacillus sp. JCM 19046]